MSILNTLNTKLVQAGSDIHKKYGDTLEERCIAFTKTMLDDMLADTLDRGTYSYECHKHLAKAIDSMENVIYKGVLEHFEEFGVREAGIIADAPLRHCYFSYIRLDMDNVTSSVARHFKYDERQPIEVGIKAGDSFIRYGMLQDTYYGYNHQVAFGLVRWTEDMNKEIGLLMPGAEYTYTDHAHIEILNSTQILVADLGTNLTQAG